jgi:hypothetical protein
MDIKEISKNQLLWLPELELGYYEVEDTPYDEEYFKKYQSYEGSEICTSLNNFRVFFVRSFYDGTLVDVGIGSGSFVNAHADCLGFDINPAGVAWLKEKGLYFNFNEKVEAVSFWDSFEHIRNPQDILQHVKTWVFMSIPMFHDNLHVLRSKHYRKDEHYWYFTFNGIIKFMKMHGFEMVSYNTAETVIGREDIGSFVFKRI